MDLLILFTTPTSSQRFACASNTAFGKNLSSPPLKTGAEGTVGVSGGDGAGGAATGTGTDVLTALAAANNFMTEGAKAAGALVTGGGTGAAGAGADVSTPFVCG